MLNNETQMHWGWACSYIIGPTRCCYLVAVGRLEVEFILVMWNPSFLLELVLLNLALAREEVDLSNQSHFHLNEKPAPGHFESLYFFLFLSIEAIGSS